ncbi:hypothetical protein Vafri_21036, partial [Volvox africanus]
PSYPWELPQQMERLFLTPSALHRRIEPYKRMLGILLRPTCVSISISNQYLTLAEPVGAFLLRNDRVPERTFVRILKPYIGEMSGVVLGSESYPEYRDLIAAPPAAETLYQVRRGPLLAVVMVPRAGETSPKLLRSPLMKLSSSLASTLIVFPHHRIICMATCQHAQGPPLISCAVHAAPCILILTPRCYG